MTEDAGLLRRSGGTSRTLEEKATIVIESVADIVTARQRGRDMASRLGFSDTEATLIATIISELARNVVLYAMAGEIRLESVTEDGRRGMVIMSADHGPGISDVQRVLVGGYSTSGGLGLGLSGVRRMVDDFHIDTKVGQGTTVVAKKWLL
jgi:serine/threonine-protein kinase RsbT